MKYYLYNPKAKHGIIPDCLVGKHVTDVSSLDLLDFFRTLAPEDEVVLVGGDGTLNRFINAVDTDSLRNKVFLLSAGTGNDFLTDIGGTIGSEIAINDYMKGLPRVFFNGTERKFINGVGMGLDGACCAEAARIREKQPGAHVSYAVIALKELLFRYRPKRVTVCVDGKTFEGDCVWLCASMKGRYFGGGIKVAPEQNRHQKCLTLMRCTGRSRFMTILRFPSILKGRHGKYRNNALFLTGNEIRVDCDEPCALQIDGEVFSGVTSYTVKA